MTPLDRSAQLADEYGRPVRLRPAANMAEQPYLWTAVLGQGQLVTHRLSAEDVAAALAQAAAAARPDLAQVEPGHTVTLTRDGSQDLEYRELVRRVGQASARWALLRSADQTQLDVPVAALSGLTFANPLFAVLLAAARMRRDDVEQWGAPNVGLVTLLLEWPLVLADLTRTHRTREAAMHQERVADEVLRWSEGRAGQSYAATSAQWTPQPLIAATRIVLREGLALADLDTPSRI